MGWSLSCCMLSRRDQAQPGQQIGHANNQTHVHCVQWNRLRWSPLAPDQLAVIQRWPAVIDCIENWLCYRINNCIPCVCMCVSVCLSVLLTSREHDIVALRFLHHHGELHLESWALSQLLFELTGRLVWKPFAGCVWNHALHITTVQYLKSLSSSWKSLRFFAFNWDAAKKKNVLAIGKLL